VVSLPLGGACGRLTKKTAKALPLLPRGNRSPFRPRRQGADPSDRKMDFR